MTTPTNDDEPSGAYPTPLLDYEAANPGREPQLPLIVENAAE